MVLRHDGSLDYVMGFYGKSTPPHYGYEFPHLLIQCISYYGYISTVRPLVITAVTIIFSFCHMSAFL